MIDDVNEAFNVGNVVVEAVEGAPLAQQPLMATPVPCTSLSSTPVPCQPAQCTPTLQGIYISSVFLF